MLPASWLTSSNRTATGSAPKIRNVPTISFHTPRPTITQCERDDNRFHYRMEEITRAGQVGPDVTGGRTSRRRILPVGPLGRASTSQTARGYL
ncbi:hypothetical protein GCM10009559_24670 [Pseudonocardia zijingensis]|uniref:Uncharacterized protein n=1 Tax=Pseudonocardia zijingensis TaxID=153376 RepID=A0ABP4ABF2_9PSEU